MMGWFTKDKPVTEVVFEPIEYTDRTDAIAYRLAVRKRTIGDLIRLQGLFETETGRRWICTRWAYILPDGSSEFAEKQ